MDKKGLFASVVNQHESKSDIKVVVHQTIIEKLTVEFKNTVTAYVRH